MDRYSSMMALVLRSSSGLGSSCVTGGVPGLLSPPRLRLDSRDWFREPVGVPPPPGLDAPPLLLPSRDSCL